ncbi:MAG: hypothetical protein M0C28_15065 [Candidatus Moduliflexus flocculans]|nr:hypothetical protein [Candidatus Moduliflexus flocculans]
MTGREVPRYHPGHDDRPRAMEQGLPLGEAGPRPGYGVRLLGQDDRRLARAGPPSRLPDQPRTSSATSASRGCPSSPRSPSARGSSRRSRRRRSRSGATGASSRPRDGALDRDARLRLLDAQLPEVRRRDAGGLGEAAGRAARSGRAGAGRRREGGHRRRPRRRDAHPLPLRLPLRLAPGLDGPREPVHRPDDRPLPGSRR